MKFVLTVILFIHSLIHFLGFAKAFNFGNMEQFTKEISKPMGLLWLLTGLLFVSTTLLFIAKKDLWAILAIISVVASQLLILTVWADAKFGAIANLVVLVAAIMDMAATNFEASFKSNVKVAMETTGSTSEILIEKDLEHLPPFG